MFDDHLPPPLHVPDLSPPPGAQIERGQVTCVVCARAVLLASTDVVGLGYRCAPCSQRAEFARLGGGGDAPSLHLDSGDANRLAASGDRSTLLGLVMLVGGVALAWWQPLDVNAIYGIGIGVSGIGAIINGERQKRLAAAAGHARGR